MKKLSVVILSIFLMGSGDVDPTAANDIALIKEVIQKYNDTSALKMGVKKEVKLSLLEDTRSSEGTLYFAKGLMRLEMVKPEKSLIVLNKEAVWVETQVEGFDGLKTHVTQIASKDLKSRSKAPLVMLMTETKAWDRFKVIKAKQVKQKRTLTLQPVKEGEYPELTKVRISFNTKNKELWFISYQDEIENVVTYKFQRPEFDITLSESKFNYKVPEGAEFVKY